MKWIQLKQWCRNAWFQIRLLLGYRTQKSQMTRQAKKEGVTKLGWHTEIGEKK
ncbi:hypothetical protein [Spirosoma foliorum]|uniref:Uncharacterized protein n=1 Tax=Spirosoma foliorum TaxID=2710596 RepID=A0A7G5GQJ6_9BACT|nr:hypothetical protein [Spirosoma foliorum]QMW01138.1 hypothetical protein H3H32_24635 [Spirosoma foliorum]